MKLKIFSDGGARGNPGPAAIGAVIYNESGACVREISVYIGEVTNNQAEYQAVLAGLKAARALAATEVDCFLDSELVVRQMKEEYKVKDKNLQKLFVQVWNVAAQIGKVQWFSVPREQNKRADQLVNQVLDAKKNQ